MKTLERSTAFGPVRGVADQGALAWKGVPYASAPVGDLRWRAPRPPAAWEALRDASRFGAAAVQTGRIYGPGLHNQYDRSIGESLGTTVGSEDCLYLNIWAPAQPRSAHLLPVIVFIHGGSNITGYTADPLYGGAALAQHADAIVVTVTYRLGIFGFLELAQLKTGEDPFDDSGNFALLDIVAALRFVNRDIASFGGDPANVTLMGQSAGAVNVWSLLTSPLLVDAVPSLVHRALPLSGGVSLPADMAPGTMPALQPLAARAAQGRALLLHALVAAGEADGEAAAQRWIAARGAGDIAAWLRAQSADSLLHTVLTALTPLGLSAAGPCAEGTVLPLDPVAALREGRYLKVPVLAGLARDEGKLFPAALALSPALGGASGRLLDDATVFALQYEYQGDAPAQTTIEAWIPPQYLPVDAPGTGFTARTGLLGALLYAPNRDLALDILRRQQEQVWHYRFDWDRQPAPFDDIYGAAHGFDVPFIFGNFGPSMFGAVMSTTANAPGRLALSRAMMDSVAAFAWNGDPNHADLGTAWPAWPATLLFDADLDGAAITVLPAAAARERAA